MKFKKEVANGKIRQIQHFYQENFNEDIGLIKAEMIFEYFVRLIGDDIYNQALDDASGYFKKQLGEIQLYYYDLYRGDRR